MNNIEESDPDHIQMSIVILPNNRIISNYSLGWENTIADEITNFCQRFDLSGCPDDYDLRIRDDVGKITVLDRLSTVEGYRNILLKNCAVMVVKS